jgi:uncharacterized protein YjbJ (UPF0337 family)
MKAEDIAGQWRELGSVAKSRWADLTDSEIERIAGDRARLEAALQAHYGRSTEQASAEVDYWLAGLVAPGRALTQSETQGTDQ